MKRSDELMEKLKKLEEQRKRGEISAVEFYKALLELLVELKDSLVKEDLNDAQVRHQIPLLLTFLKTQIKKMSERGN
jgi:molybdopterin/thiamine biosynthesis adenylyltransferase